jgi:hypothetical protein
MKKRKVEVTIQDRDGKVTYYSQQVVEGEGQLKIQLPNLKTQRKVLRLNQTLH